MPYIIYNTSLPSPVTALGGMVHNVCGHMDVPGRRCGWDKIGVFTPANVQLSVVRLRLHLLL